MKISRRGYFKDHGRKSIHLDDPKFSYTIKDGSISIKQGKTKDFSSDATHSYHLELNPSEIETILRVLAEAAVENPKSFEAHYSNSLKALMQLVVTVSGIKI